MCNRFQLKASHAEVGKLLGSSVDGLNWPDEMFPKRPGLVQTSADVRLMDWGWPSPAGKGPPVTNVRNLDSRFWRAALLDPAQRCVIPASRFCEWEGAAGSKVSRWFGTNDAPLFLFAGVWRLVEAQDPGDAVFAMLTCDPNALVEVVHPKAMPVLLRAEDRLAWLTADWKAARRLVQPYPAGSMWIE
jgi:putative SOS response-associated peptidase YedK